MFIWRLTPMAAHSDLSSLCRLTALTVGPLLTKWQMGCRSFYDLDKQAKASCYVLKKTDHNHSLYPPQFCFWRTYWLERKVCQKGDRSACCFARAMLKKERIEAPFSSSTLTPQSVSFALLFIPLLSWAGLFCHLSSTPSSLVVVVVFFLSSCLSFSCLPQLFFHLAPSHFPLYM